MARRLPPTRALTVRADGLDPLGISIVLSVLLIVVFVASKNKPQKSGPTRKVLPRGFKVPATTKYRIWSNDDMEGALTELVEQHAINTANC